MICKECGRLDLFAERVEVHRIKGSLITTIFTVHGCRQNKFASTRLDE